MGLVARRSFIGEGGRRYEAGDACDEALAWRYPALRGCLSQGLIEDTDGSVDQMLGRVGDAELLEVRAARRAERRRLAREGADARAREAAPTAAEAPTDAAEEFDDADAHGPAVAAPETPTPASADDSVPTPSVPPVDGQPPAGASGAAGAQLPCKDCGKHFATEHALRSHSGKVHRE